MSRPRPHRSVAAAKISWTIAENTRSPAVPGIALDVAPGALVAGLGPNAAGTGGRSNVNIISSDMPGETSASGPRYRRATEVMKIVRTSSNGEHSDFDGEFYKSKLDPPRIATLSGRCPAFYFGGSSEDARECAAEGCDVYSMW
ncbi:hypothetical protein OY671_009788, partial [Metschnikowia pulcherrima]